MTIFLKPQIVHQDDYLKVELERTAKFLYLEWLKSPSTQYFRDCFEKAAHISRENQCEYILSDARLIPFLDFSDQNWVIRTMAPLLVNTDLKKYARISSRESLGLLDIHRIYSSLSNEDRPQIKTQFEAFTNKDAAVEWLFSDLPDDHSFSPS